MSLKENVIYPNGYTSKFTFNNVDYDLVENYDENVYKIYLNHMENYFINFWLKLMELKRDINLCNKLILIPKPTYQSLKQIYNEFVKDFNMDISHLVVYLYTKDVGNIGMEILSLFKSIHELLEDYKRSTKSTIMPCEYEKIFDMKEQSQFTNTLKKLENSVYKDKLKNVDLEKLKKY